jgi:hypothetical protein
MRTLGKIAAASGVVAAIGISGVLPASADWYHHHRYYNYYGGGGWNTLERLPTGLDRPGRPL